MNRRQRLAAAIVVTGIVAFFALGLHRDLGLDNLQTRQAALAAVVASQPFAAGSIYFLLYVGVTALSLPGALVLSLAGGALFGMWCGVLIVSFASSIGATLAMLVARMLLRDWVRARLGPRQAVIDAGMDRDGAFYLFALRLVPLFPFFAVNLALGLTRLPVRTFYWVSQLGMLPATIVIVNLGTELARIDSLRGLLSPGLLCALALLGALPLVARRLVTAVKSRRIGRTGTSGLDGQGGDRAA